MSTKVQKAHSPLGGSSAERWINCPGSNVILEQLNLPEGEGSDFAIEGTNAHTVAAACLQNGVDGWEMIGQKFGFEVTVEMADGVQVYLDYVRAHGKKTGVVRTIIEEKISGDWNDQFYGTVDAAVWGDYGLKKGRWLDIIDFKYGAGIAVDAKENAQLKYYAVGLLDKVALADDDPVGLHIVQPRAWHPEGPLRFWFTTAGELRKWRDEQLVPAMVRAEVDHTLSPGDHCRFCPAKLACPLMTGIFGAAVQADASVLANYSDEAIARNLKLAPVARMYLKALEEEALKRLNAGHGLSDGTPEGTYKLVYKKADRVVAPDGVAILKNCIDPPAGFDPPFKPEEVLTAPEIKSPAQLDKLGPRGKEFTKQYAYTPQVGLTIAPSTDGRTGIIIKRAGERFANFVNQQEKE